MAYAVETCPGFEHPPGCLDMDALGQARCRICGWSWHAHRHYGRPHPPSPPPDYDDEAIARAFADVLEDDDDEPAGPDAERAGEMPERPGSPIRASLLALRGTQARLRFFGCV